jgi:hypothetical protein
MYHEYFYFFILLLKILMNLNLLNYELMGLDVRVHSYLTNQYYSHLLK